MTYQYLIDSLQRTIAPVGMAMYNSERQSDDDMNSLTNMNESLAGLYSDDVSRNVSYFYEVLDQ